MEHLRIVATLVLLIISCLHQTAANIIYEKRAASALVDNARPLQSHGAAEGAGTRYKHPAVENEVVAGIDAATYWELVSMDESDANESILRERILIDHVDYLSARTHPPVEPPNKQKLSG
eukprot:c16886_g1_i1 orf=103-462(-)